MASAGKLDLELELKSSADELWSAIKDANNVFPKVLPEMYKSIEVLEGDGKSAGSVRLVTLAEGSQQFTPFAHSKVEYVDEENKAVGFRVVGGDLLRHYKNYKANIVVKTKGEGSMLHWSIEFEKASEETPNPDAIRDFSAKLFQGLDAYLLSENKS